ncbi:MAG: hypothetical protein ACI9VS_000789 [Candidatus Binatia bacterium]|jgi:hypothetical protein
MANGGDDVSWLGTLRTASVSRHDERDAVLGIPFLSIRKTAARESSGISGAVVNPIRVCAESLADDGTKRHCPVDFSKQFVNVCHRIANH